MDEYHPLQFICQVNEYVTYSVIQTQCHTKHNAQTMHKHHREQIQTLIASFIYIFNIVHICLLTLYLFVKSFPANLKVKRT